MEVVQRDRHEVSCALNLARKFVGQLSRWLPACGLVSRLDRDEVADLADHAADRRRVVEDDRLCDPRRPRPLRVSFCDSGRPMPLLTCVTLSLIAMASLSPASTCAPRSSETSCRGSRATCSTERSSLSADDRRVDDVVRVRRADATSSGCRGCPRPRGPRARAPPAMTPVPASAGLSSTCAGAEEAVDLVRDGALDERDLEQVASSRCSVPLRIASGTSFALPRPAPTWPFWSPTTTSAENENRRPPLTTFATRLMWTTRSTSSPTSSGLIGHAVAP